MIGMMSIIMIKQVMLMNIATTIIIVIVIIYNGYNNQIAINNPISVRILIRIAYSNEINNCHHGNIYSRKRIPGE